VNTSADALSAQAVIEAFSTRMNEGDLDGALALYEPDALLQVAPGETPARGLAAIRRALTAFLALEGRIDGQIIKVHEAGGIALVVNRWSLRGRQPDGKPVELAGVSADVLRQQASGGWKIVVDDPWGGVA
jgi:uncharacterized protein (TIGR02246 family)